MYSYLPKIFFLVSRMSRREINIQAQLTNAMHNHVILYEYNIIYKLRYIVSIIVIDNNSEATIFSYS